MRELEKKRLAIGVLTALSRQSGLSLTGLKRATGGNWETLLRRVSELKADGLIYAKKSSYFPFTFNIGLTDKGRRVLVKFGRCRDGG